MHKLKTTFRRFTRWLTDQLILAECPSCQRLLPPSQVDHTVTTTWGISWELCEDCWNAEFRPFSAEVGE